MANYIVVKGTSGIGNRVLAVATGILYAQFSGRQLVVDWRDGSYSNTGTNLFFRYFDCPVAQSVEVLPVTDSIYPTPWQNQLHRSLGSLLNESGLNCDKDLSFDVSRLDYPETIIVLSAYTHKIHKMRSLFTGEYSHFAKLTNPEILKLVLQSNLTLKEDIRLKVEQFKQEYFSDYMIGVHIRYSDMKVPLSEIEASLQSIVRTVKFKHPNYKICLATDSQEVLSLFKEKFINVISTNKWFSPSGKRLHQNHECQDLIQNGIEALVDLYLLADCDRLLFSSQSSFGLLASLLMTNNQARRYDIEREKSLIKRVKLKLENIWKF
ncbi:xyloglucan fucosyltransferase/Nodulation protein Z (NodZ) [Phormidium pseudopriestleyi FRX01]|uniref:Xyloglucan fucosyltransferase/Nodulation protein Z (NodZ) n=1 Tax=Phormidium pseudopriestleyi FRX01 TaxID=1759528 RepID=A0ABS3FM77_9CYAN|nr:nodulation protein NodZ [Phormidium pseudopriestleyi]MBO0348185.1 xyloglucan fucosyltransferase/Nodulation protein Z (NodZ) [Phormidium pseudopriestleyi FRX01]